MEDFNLDDLDADITDFFKDDIELMRVPDEDEYTAEDIVEIVNSKPGVKISRNRVTRRMNKAIDDGKVTMRMWCNSDGEEVKVYKWISNS